MCEVCERIDNYCIRHIPPDDVYLFCTHLVKTCISLACVIEMAQINTKELCENCEAIDPLEDVYNLIDCIQKDKRVDIEVQ